MKYVALLGISGLARVHIAVGSYGVVDSVATAGALLDLLHRSECDCVVLDPALISVADAEVIGAAVVKYLRPLVVFSSITTAALETGVILAQRTDAQFVFHGVVNERATLARTLLLAPSSALGISVVDRLGVHLERLPTYFRGHIAKMLRVGHGPPTPDALAGVSRIPRRSLDRHLADAGFVSARLLIAAARLTGSYRSITSSRIPFRRIAGMLGYKSQRTMDGQLVALVGQNSASLRSDPPSTEMVASRIARALTTRRASIPDRTSRTDGKDDEPTAQLAVSNNPASQDPSTTSQLSQTKALYLNCGSRGAARGELSDRQARLP